MSFFKDKRYEIVRQFLLLGVIAFILLSTVTLSEGVANGIHYKSVFATLVYSAAIFGFVSISNYYWLYRIYFERKRYAAYLLLFILFTLAVIVCDSGLYFLIFISRTKTHRGIYDVFLMSAFRVFFLYTVFALIYTFIRANINLKRKKGILEKEQAKNSLLLIRNQLEPHFLFNTLNTVYASAQMEGAGRTAASIEELSGLFRYSLNEANKELVPVQDELGFIEKYLHLQRLRVEGNMNVEIETKIEWDNVACEIAPLLLLPFIENAFKYGISLRENSKVEVLIKIEKSKLEFDCRNTDHTGRIENESTGMGVANTIKRLELQYTNHYQLQQENKKDVYSVHLRIDLA